MRDRRRATCELLSPEKSFGNLEKLTQLSIACLFEVNRTESKRERTRIIRREFRAIPTSGDDFSRSPFVFRRDIRNQRGATRAHRRQARLCGNTCAPKRWLRHAVPLALAV